MPIHTKTPDGKDIVILSLAEYDALVRDKSAGAERANRIMTDIVSGAEPVLTDEDMDQLLAAKTPLQFWRKKRGLTQAQLSEAAGVAQGFVSDIENGNKTGDVQTLTSFARALHITLDDLVTEPGTAPDRPLVFHGEIPGKRGAKRIQRRSR